MNTPSPRRPSLCRLLQIVIALRSDRRPNARQLAEACGVSRRTIFRDLDTIEAAGFAVGYDAARQGYWLATESAAPGTTLEEGEVLALAVLANQRAGHDPFGLADLARSGLAKLIDGLPDGSRQRVEAVDLARSVESPPPAAARRVIYDRLLQAIANRVHVRLTLYVAGGGTETTLLAPYRLLETRDGWSVIGRSSLHRRVRLIPLAAVESAEATDEPVSIPPRFRAERWLERSWVGEPGPARYEVHLRFDAEAAPAIRDGRWHASERIVPLLDGRVDLRLTLDRPEDLASWVLGQGRHVEVLAPARLRRAVRRLAGEIARSYARPRQMAGAGARADFGGLGG